jgi:hypothetical protein
MFGESGRNCKTCNAAQRHGDGCQSFCYGTQIRVSKSRWISNCNSTESGFGLAARGRTCGGGKIRAILLRHLVVQSQDRQPKESDFVVTAQGPLEIHVYVKQFVQAFEVPHTPNFSTRFNDSIKP